MPYFIREYQSDFKKKRKYGKEKPTSLEEWKKWLSGKSKYQFWARCEYEIILSDWPCQKNTVKVDVDWQIQLNLDLIVKIFLENVEEV